MGCGHERQEARAGATGFRGGTARTGVFAIRLSDEERAAIEAAAERAGKQVTQCARDQLLLGADYRAHAD